MGNSVSFDGLSSVFENNIYGSNKGKIRMALLEEDLSFAISQKETIKNLRVLDLGCGQGVISTTLATMGAQTDLCDISQEMIDKAVLYAKSVGVQQNMRFFCCSAFELAQEILESKYDLILCHAVMEWVENKEQLLQQIISLLDPNGTISLMVYNRDALLYQSLVVGNFSYVASGLKSKHKQKLTPKFPCSPSFMEQIIDDCHLNIQRKTGIRVFHDYMRDKEMWNTRFDDILKYEKEYCRDPRFINLGRYIHYLCTVKSKQG